MREVPLSGVAPRQVQSQRSALIQHIIIHLHTTQQRNSVERPSLNGKNMQFMNPKAFKRSPSKKGK